MAFSKILHSLEAVLEDLRSGRAGFADEQQRSALVLAFRYAIPGLVRLPEMPVDEIGNSESRAAGGTCDIRADDEEHRTV
jgi:hypothetical protein